MSLKDRIQQDVKDAMRAKEKERLATIRLITAAIKQREVVRLFHLQGHSYLEISERLKMPMGSVGITLRRAEAKIRELLEPG